MHAWYSSGAQHSRKARRGTRPDSIALARRERPGRRPETAEALARCAELGEMVTYIVRKSDDVTSPIATRQLDTASEMFQDPN